MIERESLEAVYTAHGDMWKLGQTVNVGTAGGTVERIEGSAGCWLVTIGEAGWSYRYLKVFESGAVSVGKQRDNRDDPRCKRGRQGGPSDRCGTS
jgi:hypothetical protein